MIYLYHPHLPLPGLRRGRVDQLRRGPGQGARRQDHHLQEDRGHLHAQDEDQQRVLQQGLQAVRTHAFQP